MKNLSLSIRSFDVHSQTIGQIPSADGMESETSTATKIGRPTGPPGSMFLLDMSRRPCIPPLGVARMDPFSTTSLAPFTDS